MAYRIRISPDAFRFVKEEIPSEVLRDLHSALGRFAEAPTQYSKPARFPFAPGEQSFEHIVPYGLFKYLFHIPFKFGSDESTLLIDRIGVAKLQVGPSQ